MDSTNFRVVLTGELVSGFSHETVIAGLARMFQTSAARLIPLFEGGEYPIFVRMPRDGGDETIYARGLRNAVGITFRPGTDELWATNNGRDWLGDDQPPETVHLVREVDDAGWPRCHAGRQPQGPANSGDGVRHHGCRVARDRRHSGFRVRHQQRLSVT